MKCTRCNGDGYTVYDTDATPCVFCESRGRISILDFARLQRQSLAMRIEGTRIECLYWRWVRLPRKARRMAATLDMGDIEERLKQRKYRAKKFAAFAEAGHDVGFTLRREWRLIAEAERAISVKSAKEAT